MSSEWSVNPVEAREGKVDDKISDDCSNHCDHGVMGMIRYTMVGVLVTMVECNEPYDTGAI